MENFRDSLYYNHFEKIMYEVKKNVAGKARFIKLLRKYFVIAKENENPPEAKMYKFMIKIAQNVEERTKVEDILEIICDLDEEFYENLIIKFIKTYELYKFFDELYD